MPQSTSPLGSKIIIGPAKRAVANAARGVSNPTQPPPRPTSHEHKIRRPCTTIHHMRTHIVNLNSIMQTQLALAWAAGISATLLASCILLWFWWARQATKKITKELVQETSSGGLMARRAGGEAGGRGTIIERQVVRCKPRNLAMHYSYHYRTRPGPVLFCSVRPCCFDACDGCV